MKLSMAAARRIVLACLQEGEATPEGFSALLGGDQIRDAIRHLLEEGVIEQAGTAADPTIRRVIRPPDPRGLYRRSLDETFATCPPTEIHPSGVVSRQAWVTAERLRACADLIELGALDGYEASYRRHPDGEATSLMAPAMAENYLIADYRLAPPASAPPIQQPDDPNAN